MTIKPVTHDCHLNQSSRATRFLTYRSFPLSCVCVCFMVEIKQSNESFAHRAVSLFSSVTCESRVRMQFGININHTLGREANEEVSTHLSMSIRVSSRDDRCEIAERPFISHILASYDILWHTIEPVCRGEEEECRMESTYSSHMSRITR